MSRVSRRLFLIGSAATGLAMLSKTNAQAADADDPTKSKDRSATENVYKWDDCAVGNCHQRHGKLVLRSNGTAEWSCEVMTEHTYNHDIWHSEFKFLDAQGHEFFKSRKLDGPHMTGTPSPWYQWPSPNFPTEHYEFNFPQEYFYKIEDIIQHSSS